MQGQGLDFLWQGRGQAQKPSLGWGQGQQLPQERALAWLQAPMRMRGQACCIGASMHGLAELIWAAVSGLELKSERLLQGPLPGSWRHSGPSMTRLGAGCVCRTAWQELGPDALSMREIFLRTSETQQVEQVRHTWRRDWRICRCRQRRACMC